MQAAGAGHGRYDGIQVLRCAAALLVVVTHSTFYASERLGGGAELWSGGAKGVDIFFVISGFVMVLTAQRLLGTRDGWRSFLVHRIARVAPLYWMATTVKLAVLLLAGRYVLHAVVDWPSVVRSYLFLPSRNVDGQVEPLLGVGWTLLYEMAFYGLFAVALALRVGLFAFMTPVLAGCALLTLVRPDDFPAWMVYFDPIVLEFLFGMAVAQACLRGWVPCRSVASTVVAVSAAVLLLTSDPWGLPRWLGWGVPAALLVWGVAALEPALRNRVPRTVLFLGAASYALYLFHPLLAPVVPTVLARMGLPLTWLSVALSVAAATAAAGLIHVAVERPLMRRLRPGLERAATRGREPAQAARLARSG